MTTWTDPGATEADLAAIAACRGPRWPTGEELRTAAETIGQRKRATTKTTTNTNEGRQQRWLRS